MIDRTKLMIGAAGAGVLALGAYAFGTDRAPPRPRPPVAPAGRPVAAPAPAASAGAAPDGPARPDALAAASSRPADCLIEPSQVVKVNSSVEGVIASISADRGQFVHRGQVVAQLHSEVEEAAAAAARARAENVFATRAAASKARYYGAKQARSERLKVFLAQDAVEEAKANADSAVEQTHEAELSQHVASLESEQTRRLLAERTVRSPIDGVVTERAMSPGEYRANESSHILTIAQLDPLYVEVFAPISQLKSLAVGGFATVLPEEPVGGSYRARISVIDRVFDAASGTFGMRLVLPNPGNKLPAGLRCRIDFDT